MSWSLLAGYYSRVRGRGSSSGGYINSDIGDIDSTSTTGCIHTNNIGHTNSTIGKPPNAPTSASIGTSDINLYSDFHILSKLLLRLGSSWTALTANSKDYIRCMSIYSRIRGFEEVLDHMNEAMEGHVVCMGDRDRARDQDRNGCNVMCVDNTGTVTESNSGTYTNAGV